MNMGTGFVSREELLANAESLSQSGSFDWDYLNNTAQFSAGMFKIFDVSPEETPSPDIIFKLVHPEDLADFQAGMFEVAEGITEELPASKFRILRRDQSTRHLWSKIAPEYDQNGRLVRIFGVVRDITEQIRQETLTQVIYNISRAASGVDSSNELFSLVQLEIMRLIDASNLLVVYYLPDQDLLDVQYLTGEEEIPFVPAAGTMSMKVINDNSSLLLNSTDMSLLEASGEIVRVGRNSACWLGVPLRKHGIPFGVMAIQHYENSDAFDQNDLSLMEFIGLQVESAIRKMDDSVQISKLTNSVVHSPATVVITDSSGTIEYVNPKFEQVTGYTAAEALGKNPRILKSGETPLALYVELWNTINSGKEWRGEFKNRKKDGSSYWESASISSIKNKEGIITHFIAVKEDISARKEMESALIEAKEKAEEANQLKTSFLANLSHEIRTPMNGILGFAELLRDGELEKEEFNRYLDIINGNGNQLMNIIEDIITISNLEVKQLRISPSEFNLCQVLNELHSTILLEGKAMNKSHIELVFPKFAPNSGCLFYSDRGKLVQILVNLLRNALKFTDSGYISLTMEMEAENQVLFCVEDTGIGIPNELQEIIFERFRQADESSTRNFGGTGLGLAISKGLVELLKGEIWVNSEPGKGSSFCFRIPRQIP